MSFSPPCLPDERGGGILIEVVFLRGISARALLPRNYAKKLERARTSAYSLSTGTGCTLPLKLLEGDATGKASISSFDISSPIFSLMPRFLQLLLIPIVQHTTTLHIAKRHRMSRKDKMPRLIYSPYLNFLANITYCLRYLSA